MIPETNVCATCRAQVAEPDREAHEKKRGHKFVSVKQAEVAAGEPADFMVYVKVRGDSRTAAEDLVEKALSETEFQVVRTVKI